MLLVKVGQPVVVIRLRVVRNLIQYDLSLKNARLLAHLLYLLHALATQTGTRAAFLAVEDQNVLHAVALLRLEAEHLEDRLNEVETRGIGTIRSPICAQVLT